MSPTRTLLAASSAGALVTLVALSATAPATEGCYTHQCDQSSVTIGLAPDGGVVGTGYVVVNGSEATWYSGPFIPPDGETWQLYPGNQTITFMIPPDAGIPANATVESTNAELAAQADAQANFIPGSGQLDEFSNVSPTSVSVLNDTCALYYLRASVVFMLPDAGAPESGPSDDAATSDASDAGAGD